MTGAFSSHSSSTDHTLSDWNEGEVVGKEISEGDVLLNLIKDGLKSRLRN